MPKQSNQKPKILYLLKMLSENTDEEHKLSMKKILDILSAVDIKAERKSIYSDIEELRQYGIDVICQRGSNGGYYIGTRDFELAELKLLVDSVQSSKFITKKKSNELIKKIEGLTNKHSAKELQRQVYVYDRVKTLNETIYYNVDTLHNAISDNLKIAFKYYEYGIDKKKKLRNNGQDYIVSPYSLSFSDDNYYLIAHYHKYENLTHFRVDRMAEIRILDERNTNIRAITSANFNLGDYMKKTFDMFSGETQMVQIECENRLINAVIDKFGEEVSIRKLDDEHFIFTTNINVSPTFYAWVFTFGDKMKIVSPITVVDEFKNSLNYVVGKY